MQWETKHFIAGDGLKFRIEYTHLSWILSLIGPILSFSWGFQVFVAAFYGRRPENPSKTTK